MDLEKAEKANAARAAKHVKFRQKDWIIGWTCMGIAASIYGYTIYDMKQAEIS